MTKIRRKKLTTPPQRKNGPVIEWTGTHAETITEHQDYLNAQRKSAVATSHLISAAAL